MSGFSSNPLAAGVVIGRSVYATDPAKTRGRLKLEPRSATRTEFQRDRDRIVHSGAFRKLRNKTQVFIESEGDYYRTRLTHSLEVAQIARSVSRALGLDEDLTEALALAHDLGHTCFGHAGEDGLDAAMAPYGGFDHNEQTFRVLTMLENNYAAFDGLNLTWETLEGVVKHNGPMRGPLFPTLAAFAQEYDLELGSFAGPEAQIASLADDIAYNTHDMDDGHRAGFFRLDDLEGLPLFGGALDAVRQRYSGLENERLMREAVREVVGAMVGDLLETTRARIAVLSPRSVEDIRRASSAVAAFSPAMEESVDALRAFLHERVYKHSKVARICVKARRIVAELFRFFMEEPGCLPGAWQQRVEREGQGVDSDAGKARIVADYIAGMTDRFAAQEHRKLFFAESII
ncbi:MAG: deoxyguanosinetriphosphate triphosphohydrolase [Bdellovibrionales bacterium]